MPDAPPDWSDLPDFPRALASSCAPVGSSVRFVDGVPAMAGGKPVTLSGTKAFLQRIEIDLIAGHGATPDLATLVTRVLDTHAKHIDSVEWCRVRGEELDISLRVYGARGSQRVHLSLLGPIGRYAEQPLPEHPKPAKPRARAQPAPVKPAPVKPTTPRVPPPGSPLVLRPLTPGARPTYGGPIARDLEGRLHVAVGREDGDVVACVEPSGAVTLTPLTTREQLQESDDGAMTGAMNMSVYTTGAGPVFIDHYETASGTQERIGHEGRWHAARRGLWRDEWTLGVVDGWFLRAIVHDQKATLLGLHLASGKRSRLALPSDSELRGAAIDRSDDGAVLRLTYAPSSEQRLALRTTGKRLELGAGASLAHDLAGFVQPVPNTGGWVVASGRTLDLVRAGLPSARLFTLPSAFTAPDYAPWGLARTCEVGDAVWQTTLDFGAAEGPRCVGAVVFTAEGTVLGRTYRGVDGVLHVNGATVALGQGEHPTGYSSGPTGDMAALLATRDGLTLIWAPP